MNQTQQEQPAGKSLKHILAGVDLSPRTAPVMDRALELAAREGAMLHVAHVTSQSAPVLRMDMPYPRHAPPLEQLETRLLAELHERIEHVAPDPRLSVALHLLSGPVAREITDLAADLDADLIVVGTRDRRRLWRWLTGSTTARIMRAARCPVVVVRAPEPVPEIERACAMCALLRQQTRGAELWCEQHRHNLGRRHTYHYVPRGTSGQENMPLVVEPRDMSEPMRH